MRTHAFRLRDGQDLREEIDKFSKENHIKAGCIVTCVGSLKVIEMRLAGAKAGMERQPILKLDGPFEIVSLVGTLEEGNSHLHISVADEKGKMLGGHLRIGSITHTTCEVVIGELEKTVFKREIDPGSGFVELVVENND